MLISTVALAEKVLRRLGITLTQTEMDALCNCQPMAVESLLLRIKVKIEADKARLEGRSCSSPSGRSGAWEPGRVPLGAALGGGIVSCTGGGGRGSIFAVGVCAWYRYSVWRGARHSACR